MNRQEWLAEYDALDEEYERVSEMKEAAGMGEGSYEAADTAGFDLNERYAELAQSAAEILRQSPKIEIIHGRDPDSACGLTVFVDGERIKDQDLIDIDIDPGRGWERSDWDEMIEDANTNEKYSPAFREAAVRELEQFGDSKYIQD